MQGPGPEGAAAAPAPLQAQPPPDDAARALNRLSRALVQLLRHSGPSRGVAFRADGSALLAEALAALPGAQSLCGLVPAAVAADSKARLVLLPCGLRIRAAQGHSAAFERVLEDGAAFAPLVPLPPQARGGALPAGLAWALAGEAAARAGAVLHGTTAGALRAILASGGLARCGRVHVHFARGLPGRGGVRSGARASSAAFLFLNVRAALLEGLQLLQAANGVVLTRGLRAAGAEAASEAPVVPLRLLSCATGRADHGGAGGDCGGGAPLRATLPVLWVGPAAELAAAPGAARWEDFIEVAEEGAEVSAPSAGAEEGAHGPAGGGCASGSGGGGARAAPL